MGLLQLKDLTKKFDGATAVERVNLEVNDGEFVVLVGPSGCGKSTTLRMIAGLESITSGDLILNGKRLNEVHSSERDMAMVFQSYALYPHMSVFENIAFGMRVRRLPKQEIKKRVQKAAQILQLEHLLNRKPRELSGGQNQRVALGRAIVREPEVFLMDEPLSNLDAKLRAHMRTEIKELQQRLEATMVYVTHDQVEAMTMGDKIVVMRDGVVQQIGSPLALYNRPVNRFVGEFIGSPPMNFAAGVVVEEDEKLFFVCGKYKIKLSDDANIPLDEYIGEKLLLGIRAEHIGLGTQGEEYCYGFPVGNTENLGAETLAFFNAGEYDWAAKLYGQFQFARDEQVYLKLDPAHIHLLDAGSEQHLDDQ